VVEAPVRVGTRAIREEEVAEAIAPVISEFSLVLEGLKISGPAANRTVKITVDYTAERTDSLSLDSLAEISGAISSALDRADDRECGIDMTARAAARYDDVHSSFTSLLKSRPRSS